MILISANSQFAPHVLAHGGTTQTGKKGEQFIVAGLGTTVAVWRDSNEKTYVDSKGKSLKRITLSHYAAIVNDVGKIVPLCFHRQIVPIVAHDPLHDTFKAQVSAPVEMVVQAETHIAAEIARTLLFGGADTIASRTFRYGDTVRVIGKQPADGHEYRFLGKSMVLKSEMKIASNRLDTRPFNANNPLFFEGSKVRNTRIAPSTSADCFGIAKLLVDIIGIAGYYRAPLKVRDICRAMTRYYAIQQDAKRLTTTKTAKRKTTTVAGAEIAQGVEDNAKPTSHTRGNTTHSEFVQAGVDSANAPRSPATTLPHGNGTTL